MAASSDLVTIAITMNTDGTAQRSTLTYAPNAKLLPGETAVVTRAFFDFCVERGVPVEIVDPKAAPAPKKAPAKKKAATPSPDFMR